ncbi:MAG: GGDEF domain-containing protein [Spirochaetes bacterium]|jgi:diguanylate cyclase (GGDEF)-like protein|nr:GGDEF domain-containing protein [Spirochaetota bacterium]
MSSEKNDRTIHISSKIPGKKSSMPSDACLIELIGKQENKKYNLFIQDIINKKDYEFSIGRGPNINDIVIDDASISRQHACIYKKGDKFYIKDNGSTNGTYINDEKVIGEKLLSNQDKIKIGSTILKFLQGDIESLFLDNLREKINVDKLTGAYNKQYFEEHLQKLFSLARRYNKPLSLILFDIDDFKKINDTFGHSAGDYILSQLGKIISQRIRNTDIFARVGGEEFGILCQETGLSNTHQLADDICRIVCGHAFSFGGKTIPVTLSMGLCEYNSALSSESDMYTLCDSLLYKAKKSGKNRVCTK